MCNGHHGSECEQSALRVGRAARPSTHHLIGYCSCRAGRRGLNKRCGRYGRCLRFRCEICLSSRTNHDLVSCAFFTLNSLCRTPRKSVSHAEGRSLKAGFAYFCLLQRTSTRFLHSSVCPCARPPLTSALQPGQVIRRPVRQKNHGA